MERAEQRCPFCSRTFKKSEHLLRHKRIHTGERPFGCRFCKRVYARSDVLARHIRDQHLSQLDSSGGVGQSDDPVSPSSQAHPSASLETLAPNVTSPHLPVEHSDTQPLGPLTPSILPHTSDIWRATSLADFNEYNFPTAYEALAEWLVPATPQLNESFLHGENALVDTTAIDPSHASQVGLVQRAWPRKRISPVVCVNQRMWLDAAQHPFPNLFSTDAESCVLTPKPLSPSNWNMDDECRNRILLECRSFLLPAESCSGQATIPSSPRITAQYEHEVAIDGLSPQALNSEFPSTEVLDASLDFYFRRFHPHYPFMHPPTFDAKRTKSPLLLAMCLVGISILRPQGTDGFMRLYVPKFIRYCRLDLTYKGLGKGGTQQLLTSIACSLLVLHLALACRSFVDEHQAHMLAIQTLFIADRHGLFSAHEAPPITPEIFPPQGNQELSWTAWARVESLKRLITSLVSIDIAFTRYLDLAANIGLNKVEVHLPCEASLFSASTPSSFYANVNGGRPVLMPPVDLSAVSADLLKDLHGYGIQILFDFLALKEAAARHKLMSKALQRRTLAPLVPFLVYQSDDKAKQICDILTSVTVLRPNILNEADPGLSIAWNRLCLHLLVDVDRVQDACGRAGPAAAHRACDDLMLWCGTASARRAVLHSSQLFLLLSRYRLGDNKALVLEQALFLTAVTLSTYFLLASRVNSVTEQPPIELLNAIDWSVVGTTGFDHNDAVPYYSSPDRASVQHVISPAMKFIAEGGPLAFGGESFEYSAQSARKIVLLFAQLLDEIWLPETSEYSHLLRTIGDLFINIV